MPISTELQWTTLAAYGLLAAVCVVIGWRRPSLRAEGWALFLVALNHVAWYAMFLLAPDWLDGPATMLWSIVLRLHVAFTMMLWLILKARRRLV